MKKPMPNKPLGLIPGDWAFPCRSRKHRRTATPAVDRWKHHSGVTYDLCEDCSMKEGRRLYETGWVWTSLDKSYNSEFSK